MPVLAAPPNTPLSNPDQCWIAVHQSASDPMRQIQNAAGRSRIVNVGFVDSRNRVGFYPAPSTKPILAVVFRIEAHRGSILPAGCNAIGEIRQFHQLPKSALLVKLRFFGKGAEISRIRASIYAPESGCLTFRVGTSKLLGVPSLFSFVPAQPVSKFDPAR
jgi:hypothetical protein